MEHKFSGRANKAFLFFPDFSFWSSLLLHLPWRFTLAEAKTMTLWFLPLYPYRCTIPRKEYWPTPLCTLDIHSTFLPPPMPAFHQHHCSVFTEVHQHHLSQQSNSGKLCLSQHSWNRAATGQSTNSILQYNPAKRQIHHWTKCI